MIKRYDQNHLMSQVVCYEGRFETAGQIAKNPQADIRIQTAEALEAIDVLLEKIGADKSHLTRIQMWMADISGFEEMNAVYEKWLEGHQKPVRACVQSGLIAGGYLIEIQGFGFLPR
ncbi:RidA family protein [Helicobacter sp. 11S02596-1]|uniref:RidA family protein n=1 Tax=Helicobacter sp. 11S02596-1 TaxID=1476194 RepID=UPI000BA5520E|nr:RidA family protein [Helicobacter sp. 11S02596-1]PAF44015.1 hypothetical protein BJI48_04315 [Helicobacter sp. 11S02596-1]